MVYNINACGTLSEMSPISPQHLNSSAHLIVPWGGVVGNMQLGSDLEVPKDCSHFKLVFSFLFVDQMWALCCCPRPFQLALLALPSIVDSNPPELTALVSAFPSKP